ncbi:MAG TPA: hypothetical protein VFK47_22105, partial [Ktedonobacteraceae bacterium]|nr:hypothetical protein [Ktedonobacteraceae bacterium]
MTGDVSIPVTSITRGTIPQRVFQRDPANAPTEDIREKLFELEAQGEWIVQRVPDDHMEVMTRYGRTKRIPRQFTWHHKSCGQCGHIPGYSTSIFWLHRQLGMEYNDPTD